MKLEELGNTFPQYKPTYNFPDKFIDSSHKFYSTCPTKDDLIQIMSYRRFLSLVADCLIRGELWYGTLVKIRNYHNSGGSIILGWLSKAEALKLYELAYFISGDILELGSCNGLSTSVLSQANHNSPHNKLIYSVDLKRSCGKITKRNLRSMGLDKNVITICDDAESAIKKFALEGKKFEFVFIDHNHAYEPVYGVCCELKNIVIKGGFCLFHDFNDQRNRDVNDNDYNIYQAVMDGLNKKYFKFYGIYGTSALYRAL